MIFLTADLHLGHDGARKMGERPFETVEHMDTQIILDWNARVGNTDTVYLLGDVTLGKRDYLSLLQGNICLIRGNHDHKRMGEGNDRVTDLGHYYKLKHQKRRVILCHYPFLTWDGAHRGTLSAHGHSHGSLEHYHSARIDVGIDNTFKLLGHWGPMAWDEFIDEMDNRPYLPVDHHVPREQ